MRQVKEAIGMDYQKERAYVGDVSQLMPVKEYRLCGGRMDGVRGVDISNGAGVEATLLPDRCMDLYSLRLRGKSLNYMAPAGVTHPAYMQPTGDRWLATFPGGFLSTCGLDNIGTPGDVDGRHYPQHGQIGNAPAEQFCLTIDENGEAPTVTVRGQMRQAEMFGACFTLQREYRFAYGSPVITMTDTVTNRGWHDAPFMLLYHFNLGYPLLSESAVLHLENTTVRPRTPHAAAHVDSWREVLPPQAEFSEMCYYHTFAPGAEKAFGIDNPKAGLSVRLAFTGETLDHFVQWKMCEKGIYVMGMEPANATIDGRADAAANGSLKTLAAGQSTVNTFSITLG